MVTSGGEYSSVNPHPCSNGVDIIMHNYILLLTHLLVSLFSIPPVLPMVVVMWNTISSPPGMVTHFIGCISLSPASTLHSSLLWCFITVVVASLTLLMISLGFLCFNICIYIYSTTMNSNLLKSFGVIFRGSLGQLHLPLLWCSCSWWCLPSWCLRWRLCGGLLPNVMVAKK